MRKEIKSVAKKSKKEIAKNISKSLRQRIIDKQNPEEGKKINSVDTDFHHPHPFKENR